MLDSQKNSNRYDKYKDSGIEWIGEIPDSWNNVRLRFLCNIQTGNKDTVDKNEYGEYPFYVRSPIIERIDTYSFDGEAILTAGDGVGAGKVFHYVNGKFDYHQRVYNLHNFNKICAKFLFYYLKENFYKEIEQSNAKSTVDSIRLPMLLDFPIVFAKDLKEQEAIAGYLDRKCGAIDETIEKQKSVIEKLKEYKQSIITQAVTKGLDKSAPMKDSGIEWIGQIPQHWEVEKLKTLFNFGKGLSITKDNLTETGIPVISYGQIHSKSNTGTQISEELIRYVSETYLENNIQSLVNRGDFIFADTSEDIEGAGNCVFVDKQLTLFAGYHSIILKNKEHDYNLGKYLSYLFKTDLWRIQVRANVSGIKVYSISQKILKQITALVPSKNEQKQIAEFLDKKCSEIDKTIEDKEKLIEKLVEYKKSLIYECVTGKRKVIV